MNPHGRRLRPDLPFKRVALVLAGGGAFGAYEVGVLKAIESLGLTPSIIAGVSVGALNAVLWLSYGFRTVKLQQAWRHLRPETIGMRWISLALKAAGLFIMVLAALEVLLTLAGSPELKLLAKIARLGDTSGYQFMSLVAESFAWVAIGLVGMAMALLTPKIEDLLARIPKPADPELGRRWLGIFLVLVSGIYAGAALAGLPWPWRAHGLVIVVLLLVWLASRPGPARDWMRDVILRLLPETRGRGIWRGNARRRMIERLVSKGEPARLVAGDVHLIISACSVGDGRMHYFINWSDPPKQFVDGINEALGDVVEVIRPKDVIEAAVASSTVPVLFEPMRFRGHDYLDAGLFSNQPLHAVVADGADAILLVLVSPSSGPPKLPKRVNLIELGWRIQDLSNWRDLQTELARLPEGWSPEGSPARVCIVEPDKALPGALFNFDPANSAELIRRGEADGWRSLERAGWLEK